MPSHPVAHVFLMYATVEQLRYKFTEINATCLGILVLVLASVTKMFTLKGVQTIHRSTPSGCRKDSA
jgi:hypothetical protein